MYRYATGRRVRQGWHHPTNPRAARGKAAFGTAPAVRGVVLTKEQVKLVRRDKMDERAAEQRSRGAQR